MYINCMVLYFFYRLTTPELIKYWGYPVGKKIFVILLYIIYNVVFLLFFSRGALGTN